MIRNLLPWTAGCLLAAFSVSSCESDDIDRLAFIEERGEAAEAPFEQTLAGLMPKVEYSFAVVGLDASGQRITAPTFARFTTAYASSLVEARFETNPDETFTFTGKITPNAYTVSYRYIFDSDHNEATEAELRELLAAGRNQQGRLRIRTLQRQRRRGQGREHDVGRTLLQQQYDRRFARLRLQDGRRADGRDGRRRQ